MPKVGKGKDTVEFAYTPAGKKAAKEFAENTGQTVSYFGGGILDARNRGQNLDFGTMYKEGSSIKTRREERKAERKSKRQARKDKRQGVVKKVETKAGDYPVYKKESRKAESFRSAFSKARKAGKSTFKWKGRSYTTQTREDVAKKKADVTKKKAAKRDKARLDRQYAAGYVTTASGKRTK